MIRIFELFVNHISEKEWNNFFFWLIFLLYDLSPFLSEHLENIIIYSSFFIIFPWLINHFLFLIFFFNMVWINRFFQILRSLKFSWLWSCADFRHFYLFNLVNWFLVRLFKWCFSHWSHWQKLSRSNWFLNTILQLW